MSTGQTADPTGTRRGISPSDRERLARAVGDAVLSVSGVDGLARGDGVEIATLFPGGKVVGVRLGDPVEVHVVLDRLPVAPVADRIRAAVGGVLTAAGEERPVVVTVDDVAPAALASAPGADRAAG